MYPSDVKKGLYYIIPHCIRKLIIQNIDFPLPSRDLSKSSTLFLLGVVRAITMSTHLCCSLAHDVDNVEWALHLMSKDAGPKGGLGLHLLGPRHGVALGAGDAHGQKTLLVIRNHVTVLSVNLKMKDVF